MHATSKVCAADLTLLVATDEWLASRIQGTHRTLYHSALRMHVAPNHPQVTQYLNAGARQFGFMLRGLQELEKDLKEQNIPCVFCALRSVLCEMQRCDLLWLRCLPCVP